MTVLGGLQYFDNQVWSHGLVAVSIPMTVLGGLQFDNIFFNVFYFVSFNTDDGIRRATITYQRRTQRCQGCFNTDDGIRRATMSDGFN